MAYNKTVWKKGDVVTSAKLNKIEDALENAAELIETPSGNLFDPTSEKVLGKVLLPWDGTEMNQGGCFYTLVPIEQPGYYTFPAIYIVYTANSARIPFYRENDISTFVKEIVGTYIDDVYDGINVIATIQVTQEDINNGCNYFGFSVLYELKDKTMLIKGSTYPSKYVPYGRILTIPGLQVDMSQIVNFTAPANPLTDKIVSFNGDSICHAPGSGGYAGIIATENDMTMQNLAVSGGLITPHDPQHCISETIDDMRSDADYVILEGGVNDADFQIPVGSLSSGYDAILDTTTFAGAFENMIKKALTRFPTAKIGFIITHKCSNLFNSTTPKSYYDIEKEACEKWGISYLDLNAGTPALGYIQSLRTAYTINGDGYHPTLEGYELFYAPKITAWMKTL